MEKLRRGIIRLTVAGLTTITALNTPEQMEQSFKPALTPIPSNKGVTLGERLMHEGYFLKPALFETIYPTPTPILTPPKRLLSTPNIELSEPKQMAPRLPSTYEEAQGFIAEIKEITGRIITPEEVRNALQKFSAQVQCIVMVETTSLDAYAIGKKLELGPGQLHPKGKLPAFYKKYKNPFDPEEVFPFIEEQIALGDGNHWAGIRDGKC